MASRLKVSSGAIARTTYLIVALVLIIVIAAAGIAARSGESKSTHSSTSSSLTTASTVSTTNLSTITSKSSTSESQTISTSLTSSFSNLGCVDGSNEISGFNCSWLSQHAAEWKPSSNASIGWSVYVYDAGYDYVETLPQSEIQADLNMALSSGASCIRIDVGYDAWLTNNVTAQKIIENLVSQIKADGKCFVLGDASAENYRSSPLPVSQFVTAWESRVQTLASILKPNYYFVINEIGWYYPMIQGATLTGVACALSASCTAAHNITNWINLAQTLSGIVKSVSPSTKVGVEIEGGLGANEITPYTTFLQDCANMANISVIGYDQYGTQDLLTDVTVNNGVSTSKPVWITQTWSTDVQPSTGAMIMNNPDRASLDAYWIQVEYYYALTQLHASVIEPFYTNNFAQYTNSSALPNYSLRTPVFYEFQHLATTYGTPIS